jgi:hypothetical protein
MVQLYTLSNYNIQQLVLGIPLERLFHAHLIPVLAYKEVRKAHTFI